MNLDKIVFELKKDHEDIFVTTIKDQTFIFRPLSKYEYDQFLRSSNMFETYKAEKICELCVLYPEKYDFYDPTYAGIPETLKNKIIEQSGFANKDFVQNLLAEFRKKNEKELDRHIENLIISVFPEISLEDIKHWNIYKILDYYSRAEWIVDNIKTSFSNPDSKQQNPNQSQSNMPPAQQQSMSPPRTQGATPQHQMGGQQRVMGENLMNRGE